MRRLATVSYYDREGNRLTPDEWVRLFASASASAQTADDYRHVGRDTVRDPHGREHYVSTVWLGLDHGWGDAPPLIFETMVFCHHAPGCEWDQEQYRYSTEQQASEGHARTVERVVAGDRPFED